MGFSVDKKTDGKKLIEEILKESKSYPKFTSDGKFSLITIKNKYTYNDIKKIIDEIDILKYIGIILKLYRCPKRLIFKKNRISNTKNRKTT